jgi:hypothetical protein
MSINVMHIAVFISVFRVLVYFIGLIQSVYFNLHLIRYILLLATIIPHVFGILHAALHVQCYLKMSYNYVFLFCIRISFKKLMLTFA